MNLKWRYQYAISFILSGMSQQYKRDMVTKYENNISFHSHSGGRWLERFAAHVVSWFPNSWQLRQQWMIRIPSNSLDISNHHSLISPIECTVDNFDAVLQVLHLQNGPNHLCWYRDRKIPGELGQWAVFLFVHSVVLHMSRKNAVRTLFCFGFGRLKT